MPASGDLNQISVARLYALAAGTSATGTLQLDLEKDRSLKVSFRRGTPEHLSANDPELSLLRLTTAPSMHWIRPRTCCIFWHHWQRPPS